ncbi:MAG: tetratricopeptide repeat protein [Phycisphaerae bacterium]
MAYASSFQGVFVLDDENSIVNNRSIRDWDLAGFRGTRPVVDATFAVNYLISGTASTVSYHAVNLAIHLAAALVLMGIVRRTLMSPRMRERFGSESVPLATAVALIWAVHPLTTQAVTYLVQRDESLMGLFYLLTLYCVIRGTSPESRGEEGRTGRGEDGRRKNEAPRTCSSRHPLLPSSRPYVWHILAIVTCLLGMFCKPVMATAPVAAIIYDRIFLSASWRTVLRRWWMYAAFFVSAGAAVAVLLISKPGKAAGFDLDVFNRWEYAATQFGVITHYLGLVFWPRLCFDYGWPKATTAGAIVPYAIFIGVLLAATAVALWRRPAAGYAAAWFFLVLAPSSSIVAINDAAFEQRMYLSLAGVVALVVICGYSFIRWAVSKLAPGDTSALRTANIAAICAAGLIAAVLAVLTFSRNFVYHSEDALWQDVIDKRPDNARALTNLAKLLTERARSVPQGSPYDMELLKKAEGLLRKALAIRRDYRDTHNNLGAVLADEGGPGALDEAIKHYEDAIAVYPDIPFPKAHANLGNAFFAQAKEADGTAARSARLDAAIAEYRIAVAQEPGNWLFRQSLADALYERGDMDGALVEYGEAVKRGGDRDGNLHKNMAVILLGKANKAQALGRRDEARRLLTDAVGHLRAAVRLNPRDANAADNLAKLEASLSAMP